MIQGKNTYLKKGKCISSSPFACEIKDLMHSFLYLTAVFITAVDRDTTYLHMHLDSANISCATEQVIYIFSVSKASCLPMDCFISNHPFFGFHI